MYYITVNAEWWAKLTGAVSLLAVIAAFVVQVNVAHYNKNLSIRLVDGVEYRQTRACKRCGFIVEKSVDASA